MKYYDVYIKEVKDNDQILSKGTYIILLTRNGGGNREQYQSCLDNLATHPNHVKDWDCDWDHTYAEIAFTIPI